MTEETFGPTLPIMKVADAEEAIRLANDSPYGLRASVFTKDVARGEAVARRIEAGAVCVNDAMHQLPGARAADGRLEGLGARARATARAASASTRSSSRCWSRASTRSASCTCSPTRPRTTRLIGRFQKLLYGRGKRD